MDDLKLIKGEFGQVKDWLKWEREKAPKTIPCKRCKVNEAHLPSLVCDSCYEILGD